MNIRKWNAWALTAAMVLCSVQTPTLAAELETEVVEETEALPANSTAEEKVESNGTLSVDSANAIEDGSADMTFTVPEDFEAAFEVDLEGAEVSSEVDEILLPAGAVPGTYTVTAKDQSGKYQDLTATFTVSNYVLVNIPYAEFYEADLRNTVEVDVFTSATKSKAANGGLAGGTYHTSDNSEVSGVTFPVLTDSVRGWTMVDSESELATASGMSFAAVLTEKPAVYKAYEDGAFGKLEGTVKTAAATASLSTASGYGDYQLNIEGMLTATDRSGNVTAAGAVSKDAVVYGAIVSTDSSDYGMRALENIWKSQLAWCTGFTAAVHNCPTSSEHYKSMMGHTIRSVTYVTSEGIVKAEGLELYVPIKSSKNTVKVADAHVSEGTCAVTADYEEGFSPVYQVEGLAEAEVKDGVLSFGADAQPGKYTMTVTDANETYAPISATFQVKSDVLPARYDAAAKALVAADGVTEEAFADYINKITSVKVDGTAYNTIGMRGQSGTVIVKTGENELGVIDTTLSLFAASKAYELTIDVDGFDTLSFTVKIPTTWKTLYAGMGVDTTQTEDGYYDAVSSATKYTGYHVKDIPAVVNKAANDAGETVLDGVNLTGKEAVVVPKIASATHTDKSNYGLDEFVIVPDDTVEGYIWNDYIANLYAVTISDGNTIVGAVPWIDYYGEAATSGPHYNKVQISLNRGTSVASNGATVHRYDAFYDAAGNLKPGTYTVTCYSEGFADLTAEIEVLEYEYMFAELSLADYWKSEGVAAAGAAGEGTIRVPIRVKKSDAEAFRAAYTTVNNGEEVAALGLAAADKKTHGLKTAVIGADGTFTISAASTGTGSGLAEQPQKSSGLTAEVKEAAGAADELFRVDLTGNDTAPEVLIWKYYGSTNPVANRRAAAVYTCGTVAAQKTEAGVSAALPKTVQASLPDGTDGTGYWQLVLRAAGYADATLNLQVTTDHIVKKEFIQTEETNFDRVYGEAAFKLGASTETNAKLTYKTSGKKVVTVSSKGVVSIKGVGTAQITITAAATASSEKTTRVIDIRVGKRAQSITTAGEELALTWGQKAFSLKAKASDKGKLSYQSSDPSVVDVSAAGKVTVKGAGTAVITVNAAESATGLAAVKEIPVTVVKRVQTIKTSAKRYSKKAGQKPFSLGAKASGKGALTYTSSDESVVTVDADGKATITGAGTAAITICAAETDGYLAATLVVEITVK